MIRETPNYYIGLTGIKAINVISDFQLSYNIGTAVTYLLRSGKKTQDPIEDIQKAIHHLSYELERLKKYKDTSDLDEIINKNNNKNDNRGNKKGI
jgi:hypothetical protein